MNAFAGARCRVVAAFAKGKRANPASGRLQEVADDRLLDCHQGVSARGTVK